MTNNHILKNCVILPTIGPLFSPTNRSPGAIMDSLLSYVVQARDQRWISSSVAAEKYLKKLTLAQTEFRKDNRNILVSHLRVIREHARQDHGKTLSDEAYALIYHNVDFLCRYLSSRE